MIATGAPVRGGTSAMLSIDAAIIAAAAGHKVNRNFVLMLQFLVHRDFASRGARTRLAHGSNPRGEQV